MNEEFYVGYQGKAPPALAKWLTAISALLLVFVITLGIILLVSQDEFDATVFEFGSLSTYVGIYSETPVPNFSSINSDGSSEQYLLVSEGKHEAQKELAAFDGNVVRLSGTRIYRRGMMMLELVPGSVNLAENAPPARSIPRESLGTVNVAGEIVGSKCFLGVMNPGSGTVHRACAELCIRGGIPPLLVVRNQDGTVEMAIVTGTSGEAINQEILPFIAQPIDISGELFKHRDLLELRADLRSIQKQR